MILRLYPAFFLLFLIFCTNKILAQDPGFYLHFLVNNFHNPASAALGENKVITMNWRLQWDARYKNAFASFERPLQTINSGTGFNFIYDEAGATKQYDLGFFFNHQISYSDNFSLRIGVQPTIKWYSINFNELIFGGPTPGPIESLGLETDTQLNANIGLSVTWKKLHFGIGWRDVFQNEFQLSNRLFTFKESNSNYYAHIRQEFQWHDKWKIDVAALYRWFDATHVMDIAGYITIEEHFKIGTSYRPTSELTQWGAIAAIHFAPVQFMFYLEPKSSLVGRTFESVAQFSF